MPPMPKRRGHSFPRLKSKPRRPSLPPSPPRRTKLSTPSIRRRSSWTASWLRSSKSWMPRRPATAKLSKSYQARTRSTPSCRKITLLVVSKAMVTRPAFRSWKPQLQALNRPRVMFPAKSQHCKSLSLRRRRL
ncbi:uncharacterized protein CC84DRAFT_273676 [Paraphaeosphaeria sporulosa]|uniref:Uncharacterized protein n=1 Tax=Paraphaeosphaeria sporulosa TaxID=1460663 RepID=A0A177C172_9PLEO|nr:uncharacterized protein CC84DRAFT_273676 [Paraphaeosphaeria sporulosa]OAG00961.1 hypothetical protein CC84DRAFT_273676 [Paraphaeosphaeria sporulosa]